MHVGANEHELCRPRNLGRSGLADSFACDHSRPADRLIILSVKFEENISGVKMIRRYVSSANDINRMSALRDTLRFLYHTLIHCDSHDANVNYRLVRVSKFYLVSADDFHMIRKNFRIGDYQQLGGSEVPRNISEAPSRSGMVCATR